MPAGDETAAFALYTMLCKMCLYSFHLNSKRCMNGLTAVNTGKRAYIKGVLYCYIDPYRSAPSANIFRLGRISQCPYY